MALTINLVAKAYGKTSQGPIDLQLGAAVTETTMENLPWPNQSSVNKVGAEAEFDLGQMLERLVRPGGKFGESCILLSSQIHFPDWQPGFPSKRICLKDI